MKKVSVYDLVYYILKRIDKNMVTPTLKKILLQDVVSLLNAGWTSKDILTILTQYESFELDENGEIRVSDIVKCSDRTQKNLLNPYRIYFHNEVRIAPKPVTIDFDYNTGEVIRANEEYFLEMRASYTIEDLIKYYLSKPNLVSNKHVINSRIKGGLEWLVQNYDLELVLYMIDATNDHISCCNLSALKNVMDIQEYYSEAKEVYQRRYNESKVNGDDKIVPKKRQL